MSTQPAAHRLSKSRFLAGLQCHKQLWWRVHEPHAPELVPGPALENVLKQGTEVGRVARERFPAGVLIDLPFHEWDNRVAEALHALKCEPPAIYEGTFVKGAPEHSATAGPSMQRLRAEVSLRLTCVKASPPRAS